MARFSKPKMVRRISKGMTSAHETGTGTYFEIWQIGFNSYMLRINTRAKKGVYRDIHILTAVISEYHINGNWIEIPIHMTGIYHVDCVTIEHILLGISFRDTTKPSYSK